MPNLSFQVESAEAVPFAAAPTLAFRVRVNNADSKQAIHTVVLRCQIQIESPRRRYAPEDQEKLLDLFGEPGRWSTTLRSLLWTHASVIIPSFTGSTGMELHVPCTFDFNVAATKYFQALQDGAVPLCFLFSGSVFHTTADAALQVAPIPWSTEAKFALPVKVWKEMMDAYYPNSAWLCLRRDVFDRLYQYKVRQGIPTWEQALERILP